MITEVIIKHTWLITRAMEDPEILKSESCSFDFHFFSIIQPKLRQKGDPLPLSMRGTENTQ